MEENTNGGTSAPQPQQNAQADLKKVADSAKAAAQGFDFNKLFDGRIDNTNYMYAAIASLVLGWVLMMIPILGWIANLALAVLGFGLTARRLHDINQPGIMSLILLIPLVGLLMVIYLCWKIGDVAANTYGPVPDAKREFFRAVLNT